LKTEISLSSTQPDLFPLQVVSSVCSSFPTTLSPYAQRTIRRAIRLLEKYLKQPGIAFSSSEFTRDWLRLQLSGLEREVFMVLLLDNQNRLLAHETLFNGTIGHVEVQPREIVKAALRCNAAAMVLAHNHPSGDAEPSKNDRHITQKIKEALTLVDVRLLDHLVVGFHNVVSFAERGWL
jgi:DNA repair protein RadC